MKRMVVFALFSLVASCVFAIDPQILNTSHAQSGYDSKDITIVVTSSPAEGGRMWLNAKFSYPFLLSEADKLLNLVQTAAKKIDIAIANKSTISYQQEVGRFDTDKEALIAVAFQTRGYGSSYVVVQISGDGNKVILLLDQKDTQDFITVLKNTHNLFDDYQRQVALFK
jgi:hypothetical protein